MQSNKIFILYTYLFGSFKFLVADSSGSYFSRLTVLGLDKDLVRFFRETGRLIS